MRNYRLWIVGVFAAGFPFLPGCICALSSTQQVQLAISDVQSTATVADASVTIGFVRDESGSILCQQRELTPEECLDDYAAEGSSSNPSWSYGIYVAVTQDDGRASLLVDSRTPCTNPTFPFSESVDSCEGIDLLDGVTGVEFYVRVESGSASEILTMEFTPGNTVSGELFEVAVLSVGEPVLVEDDD